MAEDGERVGERWGRGGPGVFGGGVAVGGEVVEGDAVGEGCVEVGQEEEGGDGEGDGEEDEGCSGEVEGRGVEVVDYGHVDVFAVSSEKEGLRFQIVYVVRSSRKLV